MLRCPMRTTVTLESDVETMLKKLMQETGVSFKDAVNSSLRRALAPSARVEVSFPSYDLGTPRIDLTHALRLAADMEDDEIARELATGR